MHIMTVNILIITRSIRTCIRIIFFLFKLMSKSTCIYMYIYVYSKEFQDLTASTLVNTTYRDIQTASIKPINTRIKPINTRIISYIND